MSIHGIRFTFFFFVFLGVGLYAARSPEASMSPGWRSQLTQSAITQIDHDRRGPSDCREYAGYNWFQKAVTQQNRWCGEWIERNGDRYGLS